MATGWFKTIRLNRHTQITKAAKMFKQGLEAKTLLVQGLTHVSDGVKHTMGPGGKYMWTDCSGDGKITNHGLQVASNFVLPNKFQNLGANAVVEMAKNIKMATGDGITCAILITHEITTAYIKLLSPGIDVDVGKAEKGIEIAINAVIHELNRVSRKITEENQKEVAQIATISADGDKEIGELIAKAMILARGRFINIEEGNRLHDEVEVVGGMKLDRGFISYHFITNVKDETCEMKNPLILIHETKIKETSVLELALKLKKPLLIVAEDLENHTLDFIVKMRRHGMKVCVVNVPSKVEQQDLAVLTGGQIIREQLGTKMKGEELVDMLGSCKKVTITKDYTLVVCKKADDKKEEQKVIIVRVGGHSQIEASEKKQRVIDALKATSAAVEEGVVPGGGIALLHASKVLDNLKEMKTWSLRNILRSLVNNEQTSVQRGINIVKHALKTPLLTILSNSNNQEGEAIARKLLKADNPNEGYDVVGGKYVDMFTAGIIDPVTIPKVALSSAAGMLSLLTKTQCLVVDYYTEAEVVDTNWRESLKQTLVTSWWESIKQTVVMLMTRIMKSILNIFFMSQ